MRPSQRTPALDAALRLLEDPNGGDITLDGVAREAGMTKAGLMYHFPTREALLLAIVDHAAARIEQGMERILGKPLDETSAGERIAAYAEVAADGSTSRAEFAICAEASYRPELTGPWLQRMTPWFELSNEIAPDRRTRLTVARLAADGLWSAMATGVFPPDPDDHDAVVALIQFLTTGSEPT